MSFGVWVVNCIAMDLDCQSTFCLFYPSLFKCIRIKLCACVYNERVRVKCARVRTSVCVHVCAFACACMYVCVCVQCKWSKALNKRRLSYQLAKLFSKLGRILVVLPTVFFTEYKHIIIINTENFTIWQVQVYQIIQNCNQGVL